MSVPETLHDTPDVTYSPSEIAQRLRWSEDAQRTILRTINEVSGDELAVIQMLGELLDRLEG